MTNSDISMNKISLSKSSPRIFWNACSLCLNNSENKEALLGKNWVIIQALLWKEKKFRYICLCCKTIIPQENRHPPPNLNPNPNSDPNPNPKRGAIFHGSICPHTTCLKLCKESKKRVNRKTSTALKKNLLDIVFITWFLTKFCLQG